MRTFCIISDCVYLGFVSCCGGILGLLWRLFWSDCTDPQYKRKFGFWDYNIKMEDSRNDIKKTVKQYGGRWWAVRVDLSSVDCMSDVIPEIYVLLGRKVPVAVFKTSKDSTSDRCIFTLYVEYARRLQLTKLNRLSGAFTVTIQPIHQSEYIKYVNGVGVIDFTSEYLSNLSSIPAKRPASISAPRPVKSSRLDASQFIEMEAVGSGDEVAHYENP